MIFVLYLFFMYRNQRQSSWNIFCLIQVHLCKVSKNCIHICQICSYAHTRTNGCKHARITLNVQVIRCKVEGSVKKPGCFGAKFSKFPCGSSIQSPSRTNHRSLINQFDLIQFDIHLDIAQFNKQFSSLYKYCIYQ